MFMVIKKHKILSGVILLLLLFFFTAAGFLWHKLDLLQYDSKEPVQEEMMPETEKEKPIPSDSPEKPENEDESVDEVLTEENMEGLIVLEGEPVLPDWEIFRDKDVLNILLIGTDERSEEFNANARSDSMILVSVNRKTDGIKLVSLERGMGVPVLSGEYEGQYDWLTHMFRYGGADLLLETIRTCFKVDVEYYVRVNFHTLAQIIDGVGGVDIELTQEEADYLHDNGQVGIFPDVTAGMNRLDGEKALAYSRIRKIDSDWKRVERQRNVIQQVVYQAKGLHLLQLNAFADKVLPLVRTNLTKGEIASLIFIAPDFMGATLEQMTIPVQGSYGSMTGMGGRHLYAVDFEENAKVLHDFLYE